MNKTCAPLLDNFGAQPTYRLISTYTYTHTHTYIYIFTIIHTYTYILHIPPRAGDVEGEAEALMAAGSLLVLQDDLDQAREKAVKAQLMLSEAVGVFLGPSGNYEGKKGDLN